MNNGETVKVSVAGQDFQLPTTMAACDALAKAGLCPLYLSQLAAVEGRPFILTIAQAAGMLAIGMRMAGLGKVTRESLWEDARRRDMGMPELRDAALSYVSALVSYVPSPETPAPPEGSVPKE